MPAYLIKHNICQSVREQSFKGLHRKKEIDMEASSVTHIGSLTTHHSWVNWGREFLVVM
jgi:hypothetical protein